MTPPELTTPAAGVRRKVLLIGIGAGNPDYMTLQAIDALRRTDVLFLPRKGLEKDGLSRVRREICDRFMGDRSYRTVEFDMPKRRAAGDDYGSAVADWHAAIADLHARLLTEELDENQVGAFLIWGDPSLYDSVMRVLDSLNSAGRMAIDYEVIPGITSIQALTARHRVPLNGIGQSVLITTGRRFAEGDSNGCAPETLVVMLDGEQAFVNADPDLEIFWGAYVGTADEILVSGRLGDVADKIVEVRETARKTHGWIMDTYLLRRPERASACALAETENSVSPTKSTD